MKQLVHKRVVIAAICVVLVVVAAAAVAWRVLDRPSTFERAVTMLPSSTLRASYTDWAAVRSEAGGTSLGASSSTRDIDAFLARAYDKDLAFTSALATSTAVLGEKFGFSPLDAIWEMYAQSPDGAVDVLQVSDSVDLGDVEDRLRDLGYTEPADGAGTEGVWAGGADLVAQIDGALTPVQQNVVVLPEEHVVLMSDSQAYASSAAEVVTGSTSGSTSGLTSALTEVVEDPVTAMLWADDFACEDLSMGIADDTDQRAGEKLVQSAGRVSPLAGLVMAQDASREITVGMLFESSSQASDNLQPRVDLASGAAPGQGGSFADRFTVVAGETSGSSVVLALEPEMDTVLSDISQGPVLFATC